MNHNFIHQSNFKDLELFKSRAGKLSENFDEHSCTNCCCSWINHASLKAPEASETFQYVFKLLIESFVYSKQLYYYKEQLSACMKLQLILNKPEGIISITIVSNQSTYFPINDEMQSQMGKETFGSDW